MKEKNVVLTDKVILVTGAAGFIGSNLVLELLQTVSPVKVIGIDNMNDYYDVSIKEYRLKKIEQLAAEHGLPVPPYAIYNIGNNHPENLLEFVDILQQELIWAGVLPADYDFESHKKLVPMQPGDVPVTYADTTALEEDFGFRPKTSLRDGLRRFAEWYREFYMG